MSQHQPTIRSGEKIPHLDGTNDDLVYSREFLNKLISVGNSILSNPEWVITDHGIISRSVASGKSSTIQMFAITTLSEADYFLAKKWDGTTLGASNIAIAKSPRLRPSVETEYIDGVTINYTYTDDNNRMADDGADSEAQVAFPRFITLADIGLSVPDALSNCQAIVFAVEATTGIVDADGKAVGWIELQPARVWARRYLQ